MCLPNPELNFVAVRQIGTQFVAPGQMDHYIFDEGDWAITRKKIPAQTKKVDHTKDRANRKTILYDLTLKKNRHFLRNTAAPTPLPSAPVKKPQIETKVLVPV